MRTTLEEPFFIQKKQQDTISSQNILLFALCAFVYIFAWYIQQHSLLNRDVSWLLDITQRLKEGGQYVNDFFEVDPPGILYIYYPVIWLKQCPLWTTPTAFYVYIFLLASISLASCAYVLRRLDTPDYQRRTILWILTIIFLVMPIDELGQKEHIFVILSLPYILHLAHISADVSRKHWFHTQPHAIWISLMAAVGFCIKPYFLILPGLLESYHCLRTRNRWSFVRIDTGIMALVILLYTGLLLRYHSAYLSIEVPLLLQYFYASIDTDWFVLLFHPISCFFYLIIALFITQNRARMPIFTDYLAIATVGTWLIYLLQRTVWYYHLLPVFSLSTLLFCAVSYAISTEKWSKIALIIIISLVPFTLLHNRFIAVTSFHQYHKPLQQWLRQYADQKSVYVLSTGVEVYPYLYYSRAIYKSRFEHLIFLPELIRQAQHAARDNEYIRQLIIDDLYHIQPEFILINQQDFGLNGQSHQLHDKINYINYLSHHQDFQTFWQHYHYQTHIEAYNNQHQLLYAFDIYQVNK